MWRLIDFGMATPRRDKVKMSGTEILSWEEISGEKYVTKKRRQKKKVGTMACWSPEQIASVFKLDEHGRLTSRENPIPVGTDARACDLFALGIVLYISLLGCHPFDPKGTGDVRRIAENVLKSKTIDLIFTEKKLAISSAAEDIIRRLLDPDPEKRMTTAEALRHPWISRHEDDDEHDYAKMLRDRSGVPNRDEGIKEVNHKTERAADLPLNERQGARNYALFIFEGRLRCRRDERASESQGFARTGAEGFLASSDALLEHAYACYCDAEGTESAQHSLNEFTSMLLGPVGGSGYLEKRTYIPGEAVFKTGESARGLFILNKGSVWLQKGPERRGAAAAMLLWPGSIFGDVALLAGTKRLITMQCVTPVEVVFIPRHDLLAAIARSPSLRGRLLRVIRKQQARAELLRL